MERDFMGLAVKQEIPDEPIDAAPVRSSAMQWSFSNKGSASPQLFSFQEGKPKTGFDSLASTGLVTITTSDSFDSDRKSFSGGMQKSSANYTSKNVDASSVRRSITTQMNLTSSFPKTAAINQPFVPSSGQSLIGSVSPQPISVVPVANPAACTPSRSAVVGTTELRTTSKISKAPAQLTIFYNGTVCVYDNISPEKAQAIMLLAGNSPPAASNPTPPSAPAPVPVPAPAPAPALATVPASAPTLAPVLSSTPRPSSLDGFVISSMTPLRSSPLPATVVSVSQSAVRSASINDLTAFKSAGVLVAPEKAEPLRSVHPLGSAPPTNFMASATVPQFRRKSLARFLERRKERVISTSPYGDKQSADCSNPGGGSVNSSGSCPVQAMS